MNAPLPQLLGCLVLMAPAAAQIQDMGNIPGENVGLVGMSKDGRVIVGDALTGDPGALFRAYRFRDTDGFQLLGTFGGGFSRVADVSDSGEWATGQLLRTQAVRWGMDGVPEDLGSLGSGRATPVAISGDGSTVVGFEGPSFNFGTAFRWTEATGMVSIEPPSTNSSSKAVAVSHDGSVVAGFATDILQSGAFSTRPYVWSSAQGITFIDGAGLVWGITTDMSADGSVVVGYGRFGSGTTEDAWVWTAATGLTLIGYVGPGPRTIAKVSADGSTVYGWNFPIGYRWTQATGLQVFSGVDFFSPENANDDGTVLVGFRSNTSSTSDAIRWTLSGGIEVLPQAPGVRTVPRLTSGDGSIVSGDYNPTNNDFRVFRWREDGTIGGSYCEPAAPNSVSPTGASFSLSGTNITSEGELILRAQDLPPMSFGFFVGSPTEAFVAMPGGSQGNLCLGGAIGRFVGPGQIQNSGAAGVMELAINPALLASPTGPVIPSHGEMWHFQAWYRDANPGSTSNFSSAARIPLY